MPNPQEYALFLHYFKLVLGSGAVGLCPKSLFLSRGALGFAKGLCNRTATAEIQDRAYPPITFFIDETKSFALINDSCAGALFAWGIT